MHDRHHGLDVLRASAIAMVLLCHTATSYGLTGAGAALGLGGRGVDLFFVLSGYLLGRQLCREVRDSGRIGLRRFWLRRWLRTLPAYYAVLGLTFLQAWLSGRDVAWPYLVFAQTFTGDMPYFGVSWSLCVEEHFYLLIAPLLACFAGRRGALPMFVVLLAGPEICRQMGWYGSMAQTHVRINQCAAGVALAYLAVWHPGAWRRVVGATPMLLAGAGLFFVLNVAGRFPGASVDEVKSPLLWGIAFAAVVASAAGKTVWRVRLPGVHWVATRSYAMYLLHTEAIAAAGHLPDLPFAGYLAVVLGLTFAASELLYRLIERPGMDLRDALEARSLRGVKLRLPGLLRRPSPAAGR